MSVLLTDEAVEASGAAPLGAVPALRAFIRFHATEGRGALIELIWAELQVEGEYFQVTREQAGDVVERLFGKATNG